MATEIKVPSVGESITEGTIARWLKKDGEQVKAEEPVLELETDKATTEIPAPAAGTLRVTVPEGSTVVIGSVVGRIEQAETQPPPSSAAKQDGARRREADGSGKADARTQPEKPAPAKAQPSDVLLSPAARRLAEQEQIDVQQLAGSGRAGRITKEDILAHLGQRQEPAELAGKARSAGEPVAVAPPLRVPALAAEPKQPQAIAGQRETRQRMTSIRQRIAEKLVAAQHTAAILTTFNEADLSAVIALRNRYKETFKEKHGANLGFMSFFVKAAVEALKSYPIVNAWIDGSDIVFHHCYNIGVAVSTEKGLMVPVLRDAERLSFADIEKRLVELAQKARDGKIAVDDLQGGTFTITNGGIFGSLLSTPILNPPQSAILGMHAIQKRPVAVDEQVVIRPMMYLALSYDHRLIDGRDAVLFLVRIKECIENPDRMLLQV
ncbi:MAG TPA: 2-oxoglutarate dehydrogenase complex dihydrolipoyllysine-residue succinyltransferase [Gemmataceae bacterium]|jgi:2-oxoglutarate dehydrogenase E2 component (dihydrolipoamide succinyltransferase)|nr:2-oxoglutarate dehydrogenase complex dihydrolipoyllysine-residue succinyltransferase [Gemmataceae bacterium]